MEDTDKGKKGLKRLTCCSFNPKVGFWRRPVLDYEKVSKPANFVR